MDRFFNGAPVISKNRAILPVTNTLELEAQLAISPRIAEQAYKVRHRGYHAHGYIDASDDRMFRDKYDLLRNQRTIVIYRGSVPVATLRVCLFDADHHWPDAQKIPAMEVFGVDILELVDMVSRAERCSRVVEIGRLAIDPAYANDRSLLIAGFRIAAYLRLYFDADIVVNAVHAHHSPIYRRLGFQEIQGARAYPNVNFLQRSWRCLGHIMIAR